MASVPQVAWATSGCGMCQIGQGAQVTEQKAEEGEESEPQGGTGLICGTFAKKAGPCWCKIICGTPCHKVLQRPSRSTKDPSHIHMVGNICSYISNKEG